MNYSDIVTVQLACLLTLNSHSHLTFLLYYIDVFICLEFGLHHLILLNIK